MDRRKALHSHAVQTKQLAKRRKTLYSNGFAILFVIVCALVYYNSSSKKNEVIASLDTSFQILQKEKTSLLRENEDLLLQINSQSDPAWIQMTLKKGLGLVPEGQVKVYFH